jgi:Flp pilus assembly protein TadD
LAQQGKLSEAIQHFAEAEHIEPDDARIRSYLVVALAQQGKPDEAVRQLSPELRSNPKFAGVIAELGAAFESQGKLDDALARYRQAAALAPFKALYRLNVGVVLHQLKRTEAATVEFREAQRCDPRWWLAASQVAWRLATHPADRVRNGTLAVQLAQDACNATNHKAAPALDALAAAHAEVGHFNEAVDAARKAIALATQAHRPDLVQQYEQRLRRYEAHRPFRAEEKPSATPGGN